MLEVEETFLAYLKVKAAEALERWQTAEKEAEAAREKEKHTRAIYKKLEMLVDGIECILRGDFSEPDL